MHLANCKVVPKTRGRRWLCYYLFVILHFSETIWDTNDELISNFLHWSYLFHSKWHYYEPITKGLEFSIMAFESSIYKYCKIWIIHQDNEKPLICLYYYHKISMTLGKIVYILLSINWKCVSQSKHMIMGKTSITEEKMWELV